MVRWLHHLLAAGLAAGSSLSADLPAELAIDEGGVTRVYEVATDCLWCRPATGAAHLVRVSDKDDAGAIRDLARSKEAELDPRFDLLLYQKGKARVEKARRSLSRRILVELDRARAPEEIADACGATACKVPAFAEGFAILSFPDPGDSLAKLAELRTLPGVRGARPLLAKRKTKRLTPNDPRFAWSASNNLYQWHLNNTGQNGSVVGHDINVSTVWDSYLGTGVTIAIVDDGLQVNHPDLAPNVNTALDHDWNDATPDDPTPSSSFDDHGTSCAGVAAARGDNSIGVSGAAPRASLVGLRLLADDTTAVEDAEALAWLTGAIDISSNSWGEPDDGDDLYPLDPLVAAALASGVANGRGGKGTIYVWAAGNGRDENNGQEEGDYSNYEGFNNAAETISVGAVDYTARQAYYSESGANVLISAPSDARDFQPAITTTTLQVNGSYTDTFGGTSSATPLVAGCIALMLEAKPGLGWRDVQEILIGSAEKVDAADPGWSTNGAGFDFHHGYGAGMVDAAAAVELAESWENLPGRRSESQLVEDIDIDIPDEDVDGIDQILSFSNTGLRVEHARLKVDIEHPYRGDLAITLTSPAGTVSQFTHAHSDSNADMNFTFLSVHNWGESADGNWTLNVSDREFTDQGVLRSLELELFGSDAPVLAGYDAWVLGVFNKSQREDPPTSGLAADPDGDGRPNLYEYALGGDPLVIDLVGEPQLIEAGGSYRLRYVADLSKTDIGYEMQVSSDLAGWVKAPESVVSTNGSLQTREVTLSVGDRRFARLVITR